MSLVPLENPIGFGALDFVELAVAVLLVAAALSFRPWLVPMVDRLSRRTWLCMLLFATLPVALRLVLLPGHPVPAADLYDEFGHLLTADTLLHGRLANPPHPMHRFFETFFVLQQPTYSSIYPVGNGLMLAFGILVFRTAWAGVLLGTSAFCALCYWMLRGWIAPRWAFFGGLLAVFEFGPLNQWTNNYWGGEFSAAAGCLVFGALPRRRWTIAGAGVALHLLSRPYESIYLILAVLIYLVVDRPPRPNWRQLAAAGLPICAALMLTLLQNKCVTGRWTELPYQLSQYQYGVPAALTFQPTPTPHAQLTPEQELDYRMQSNFHPGKDTVASYFARLLFRIRYYRFYFYAPLYLALAAFLITMRGRWLWVAGTCLLFALGINFFPAFQFHYLAAVVCLFVLISVEGLRRIASNVPHGRAVAQLIAFLCVAQFAIWYTVHIHETSARTFDLWDSINHTNPERRIEVAHQLARIPGKLLVFVRYWPQHIFQDEWVYNAADIDAQRIVWARDLGDDEDRKLIAYYKDRNVLLLEPDARPPQLNPWAPAEPQPQTEEKKKEERPQKHPLIELEQVR